MCIQLVYTDIICLYGICMYILCVRTLDAMLMGHLEQKKFDAVRHIETSKCWLTLVVCFNSHCSLYPAGFASKTFRVTSPFL